MYVWEVESSRGDVGWVVAEDVQGVMGDLDTASLGRIGVQGRIVRVTCKGTAWMSKRIYARLPKVLWPNKIMATLDELEAMNRENEAADPA